MLGDKAGSVGVRLAVDEVVDAALAVERNVLGLVPGNLDITHLLEQPLEFARVGMGELHEFEAIRAGGVIRADARRGRIVRERTHRGLPA